MISIDSHNTIDRKRDAMLRCPFRAMNEYVRVTWGGVHPHSRIHLPQADMLCPVGAKRHFFPPETPRCLVSGLKGQGCLRSGLKGHGMSALGNAQGLTIQRDQTP